jgi:DNA replication protein DnaC
MLNQPTLEKMQAMKMSGMVEAFREQIISDSYAELSFEERLSMLIDAEYATREQRKLTRRLQRAKLRHPNACIEDIDFKVHRGLDRQTVMTLARCDWIRDRLNVLITGPTGTGKTYLACALANRASRSGFTAYYVRASQLPQDLAVARGDGSYPRLLKRLTRTSLLVIDDWLLTPLTNAQRCDILEAIEDRHERTSTLIASQLPVSAWHDALGEPTLADSICDRLIHAAHQIKLDGPSMRKVRADKRKATDNS